MKQGWSYNECKIKKSKRGARNDALYKIMNWALSMNEALHDSRCDAMYEANVLK